MEKFFYPQSVAVVGVSEAPDNLAQGIVANLLEFRYRGKIFLVGRRPGKTFGLPIFAGLRDLPEPVDLAAILTPARFVPELVAQCGELGISRIVVESGGFGELGEAGQPLEEEVRRLLQQYNLRLVGPNGLGLVNTENGLALPFSHMRPKPRPGPVSILAQSGGVGMHLLAWMSREGLGLNKFVSLGNKLNVAENEVLEYLLHDPGTAAIYLYLEGLKDGRGLIDLARRSAKPVFLHMVNVAPETAAIAQSHTASLATDERVLEAACRQAGILRIKGQAEFLVGAKLAANVPVRGNQVVVLSRSGGEAVITAYALREHGFSLPPLSPAIRRDIEARSRSGVIKPTNPIDLGDIFDFQVYTDIMSAICHDPDIDVVILNYGPLAEAEREEGRRMARLLVDLAREHQKTLAITVVCTLDEEDYLVKELGVPVFHFPGEAVRALAYSRYFAAKGQVAAAPAVPLPAPQEQKLRDLLAAAPGDGFMPMPQALSLMEALGLPLAPWWTVTEAGAAAAAAGSLGYPVVMKLSAPSLVHKTEAGAVLLNLMNEAAVRQAFARLEQAAKERVPPGEAWQVVVMQQVQGGREALLGTRRDPAFGPVAAFGTGGVETEILADVALRVAPLSAADARELMAETRLGRLLAGFRGEAPADLEGLGRALTALGQLLLTFPAVQEVDLNPVRVFPGDGGFMVLDARVRLG